VNVIIIGLGSMGRRRIRLIRKYNQSICILGIDHNVERRSNCEKEYEVKTYNDFSDVKEIIDCAFVCTSPLSHHTIINECLSHGIHVFTELNLVPDGYLSNMELAKRNNLVLFMSSTFLYRSEIQKIKELTKNVKCKLNYTYHVGQYLPDWHPWEDYQNYFVKDKRSNACREIFAIELPWLTDVFGPIASFSVVKNKMSNLHIDYCDNYLLIISHHSGCTGSLAIDIVSRKAVRNLEIFGEELYLSWDGTPSGLQLYDINTQTTNKILIDEEVDRLDHYSSFIIENAYFAEINSFFAAVTEGIMPKYNFANDLGVLKIIDQIEAENE